ncbi:MAG: formimidoylglutamase [Bacteroidales bacterium]|jgi:arginase family enzyme|nr:formimidoylglutamase [Bacteroidales bacterium]
MEISNYFSPINLEDILVIKQQTRLTMGQTFLINHKDGTFPVLDKISIAIVGVNEDRGSLNNRGASLAANEVRKYLYDLSPKTSRAFVADLGNIILGEKVEDTYIVLSEVIAELLKLQIIPLIIGGTNDLVYANYKAYENIGQIINMFSVDSRIDLSPDAEEFNSKSYLTSLMCSEPNYLFNYTLVGYQQYFVDTETINLMNSLFFETYRLGEIQKDITRIEPLVRNADMVSIDISSVRQGDAPGNKDLSPHGFYGEELCAISRYAGMSDKCSSIGFYEVNPLCDSNGQTSHLIAHAIWYFIDGFLWRKNDFPYKEKENYKKFYVSINDGNDTIIFYKSKKSERWWMEVPCNEDKQQKYLRHYLIPCSMEDYQTALNNDIPNRWINTRKKMNL